MHYKNWRVRHATSIVNRERENAIVIQPHKVCRRKVYTWNVVNSIKEFDPDHFIKEMTLVVFLSLDSTFALRMSSFTYPPFSFCFYKLNLIICSFLLKQLCFTDKRLSHRSSTLKSDSFPGDTAKKKRIKIIAWHTLVDVAVSVTLSRMVEVKFLWS